VKSISYQNDLLFDSTTFSLWRLVIGPSVEKRKWKGRQ